MCREYVYYIILWYIHLSRLYNLVWTFLPFFLVGIIYAKLQKRSCPWASGKVYFHLQEHSNISHLVRNPGAWAGNVFWAMMLISILLILHVQRDRYIEALRWHGGIADHGPPLPWEVQPIISPNDTYEVRDGYFCCFASRLPPHFSTRTHMHSMWQRRLTLQVFANHKKYVSTASIWVPSVHVHEHMLMRIKVL